MEEKDGVRSRLAFKKRRRRKRSRQTLSQEVFNFQENDSVDLLALSKRRKERKRNELLMQLHPMLLLDKRSTGRRRHGWQAKMMKCNDSGSWKPHVKQSIRFSQLESTPSEAVLAIQRDGSYFVSLAGGGGGGGGAEKCPLLSLRFYGVPSPAMLKDSSSMINRNARLRCPLVQTIPLLFDSVVASDESASPVATTPVEILVSSDWSVGMAFVHNWSPSLAQANLTENPATPEEDSLGTMVLFSLPGSHCQRENTVQSFRCCNVRLSGRHAYSMRNLLWNTHQIPFRGSYRRRDGRLCNQVVNLPGYLFLNDEDDGFRMTWVMCAGWAQDREQYLSSISPSTLDITPTRHDIITESDEVVWDRVCSDRYSGSIKGDSYCESDFVIAFEAYFRVDALLDDIRARRKDTFDYRHESVPNFHYNLIGIEVGRIASMVICFGKSNKSVGVFLEVDIFTQHYEEKGWVQSRKPPTCEFLRAFSNSLALTRRLKDEKVGPFCTNAKSGLDSFEWSMFYNDTQNSYNGSHDTDPQVWGPLVDRIEESKRENKSLVLSGDSVPKSISGTSLFSDCDLITNTAVRLAKPVSSIECRDAPIQFVYG